MVCSPVEKIIPFPSLDLLGVFCVRQKVFNLTSAHFSPKNVKTPRQVLLKTLYTAREIFIFFFMFFICMVHVKRYGLHLYLPFQPQLQI